MMKKLALVLLGTVGALVALVNIGSIAALLLSTAAALAGWHYFKKSDSTIKRILWGILLTFGVLTGISNIPAFIGILAAAAAYYAYRSWKLKKQEDLIVINADPFAKFEKQWKEFTK